MVKSILIGPFKVFLLMLAVFVVHQIITRQPIKNYGLDYVMRRVVLYGSAILLLIFVMVQLNMYDIFSILIFFLGTLILLYLGKGFSNLFKNDIGHKREDFLLSFFKFMEKNINVKHMLFSAVNFFKFRKLNLVFLAAITTGLVVFFSRYFFLNNDLYTFSNVWIKNLETIKSFNANNWFSSDVYLVGELALLNFYAKVTNVSEEMALYSFGLLENLFLGIIIYWVLVKVTLSKFVAPIFGVLFFAFFYQYLPLNINHVLEHNPLYLALCFGLPTMLFIVKPKLLNKNKKKYFISLLVLFLAISLISFYVSFIIIPIFIVLSLPFNTKKSWSYTDRTMLAYILSVAISLSIHYFMCWVKNISFNTFLSRNFIFVDYYTFSPQIVYPLDLIVLSCSVIGILLLGLYLPSYIKRNKKWRGAIIFLLTINVFLLSNRLDFVWLDKDLYYQVLPVFMALLVGFLAGRLNYILTYIFRKKVIANAIMGLLFVILYLTSTSDFSVNNYKKSEPLKGNLLKVYNDLSKNYMPYSYAVINQAYGFRMSKNSHLYFGYKDFIEKYNIRDDNFQKHKDDIPFLKENPQFILPQSVFVFIAKNNGKIENKNLTIKKNPASLVEKQIEKLKRKGRTVNIYFTDETLTVYEIVNTHNESKLSDLIL